MTWGIYKMRHLCLGCWNSAGKAVHLDLSVFFQSMNVSWIHQWFSGYICGYILFNFNCFWHWKSASEYYLRRLIQIATFLSYSFSFYFLLSFSHLWFSFLSRPLFYRIFTSLSLCLLLSLDVILLQILLLLPKYSSQET